MVDLLGRCLSAAGQLQEAESLLRLAAGGLAPCAERVPAYPSCARSGGGFGMQGMLKEGSKHLSGLEEALDLREPPE